MRYFVYILLGILQGILEPIPISSSGHLYLISKIFTIQDMVSIEIYTHFGSILAIIIFYFSTIQGYFRDLFQKKWDRILCIIIGIIPCGIIGFLVYPYIETLPKTFCGYSFLFTGILLFLLAKEIEISKAKNLEMKQSFFIGTSQILALLPGISRSGITIFTALKLGIPKEKAFEFSFMMLLPISIGAFILDLIKSPIQKIGFLESILLVFFSFLFTYLSLLFLKKIYSKKVLYGLSIYAFLLGILTLFLLK